MMVGDNIYRRDQSTDEWLQSDSHHSHPDGSPNSDNITNDTKADRVLLSTHFFYFGREAPLIPVEIWNRLGYSNGRNYRVYDGDAWEPLIAWLERTYGNSLNVVLADPFDFDSSGQRYSVRDNKIR